MARRRNACSLPSSLTPHSFSNADIVGRGQATEQDLYSVFSPIGDIIELYVLRNSNGKSRGCAFVTYVDKYRAAEAISQLNGKQVPPGKNLVVKVCHVLLVHSLVVMKDSTLQRHDGDTPSYLVVTLRLRGVPSAHMGNGFGCLYVCVAQ
jgi:hypothetical protein